ncbi:fungal-specific transcription factor domain-containing protein [Gloeopeniophorella convolvens]|nr:fungal-specific transcription factor domain-containing protein [Gloeopeniophorella convolvens]
MSDEYSANPSRSAAPTLQRGKACLRCRKRKMRCDGSKPSCQQCVRAKKHDLCEYDDGKGKTRTQILRETIARLEARVKELEDPERASTSVPLFDPHAINISEDSSSSGADSPSSFPFSQSQSPLPIASISSPPPLTSTPPISWMSGDHGFPDSPNRAYIAQIPVELAQSLLDVFIPHCDQLFFGAHINRLRDSLRRPMDGHRHPVLMNSIFLWACYFSQAPNMSQHEPLYLSRATEAFHDWLLAPNKVVDVIQGCCLLAQYFLANGRVMEGSHYMSTATSLALQWGLHREASEQLGVGTSLEGSFSLPPTQDVIERGERILAFWQVFCLDRCWSVALHRPSLISDGPGVLSSITVPWPQDIVDYEAGNFNDLVHMNTVQTFLAHQVQVPSFTGGFSNFALRAKASALLDAAAKVASSWNTGAALTQPSEQEMLTLESSITRFIAGLIPVHQMGAVHASDRHSLIVVHTLAQAALIRLYYPRGEADQLWSEKCMLAANGMLFIVSQIPDVDFEFLDPVIGSCWSSAAHAIIREITQLESWSSITSTELRNQAGTIIAALSRLSMTFPMAGMALYRDKAVIVLTPSQGFWPPGYSPHSAYPELPRSHEHHEQKTGMRSNGLLFYLPSRFQVSQLRAVQLHCRPSFPHNIGLCRITDYCAYLAYSPHLIPISLIMYAKPIGLSYPLVYYFLDFGLWTLNCGLWTLRTFTDYIGRSCRVFFQSLANGLQFLRTMTTVATSHSRSPIENTPFSRLWKCNIFCAQ